QRFLYSFDQVAPPMFAVTQVIITGEREGEKLGKDESLCNAVAGGLDSVRGYDGGAAFRLLREFGHAGTARRMVRTAARPRSPSRWDTVPDAAPDLELDSRRS